MRALLSDDDACDGWRGCGEDGCCVDDEWWAQALDACAFERNGVVHLAVSHANFAWCGLYFIAEWTYEAFSLEVAQEVARQLAVPADEVNCLECIATYYASLAMLDVTGDER